MTDLIPAKLRAGMRLLSAQESFYFGALEPAKEASFNVAECIVIEHLLDMERLTYAIERVVQGTEALHLNFYEHNQIPSQVALVRPALLDVVDFSQHPQAETLAWDMAKQSASLGFALASDRLYRQSVFKINERKFLWLFCCHHILLDGYAVSQVLTAVATTYAQGIDPRESMLDATSLQTLLLGEEAYRKSPQHARDHAYWRDVCTRLPPPVSLSRGAYPAQGILRLQRSFTIAPGHFELERGVPNWLTRLIATVLIQQYRLSAQTHQVIGLPLMARRDQDSRRIPACRVNVLPLAVKLRPDASVLENLLEVESVMKGLLCHQHLPGSEVKQMVDQARAGEIFHTIVNVLPFAAELYLEPGHSSRIVNLRSGNVTDLVFNIRPGLRAATLEFSIDADARSHDYQTLTDQAEQIMVLFEELYRCKHERLVDLGGMSLSLNEGEALLPSTTLMDRISEQARRRPWQEAVQDPGNVHVGSQRVNYADLLKDVAQIAAQLLALPDRAEALVLSLPRSYEAILFSLVALELRIPFVPLTINSSSTSCERVLRDVGRAWLVSSIDQPSRGAPRGTVLSSTGFGHLRVEWLESETEADLQGIAYLLYTSGSTGRGKGVLVARTALDAFVSSAAMAYGIRTDDRVLNFANPHFDAWIEETLLPLSVGASVIVRDDSCAGSSKAYFGFCQHWRITLSGLPTAFWHELSQSLDDATIPTCLRQMVVGGERLSEPAVRRWFGARTAAITLINSYGPTEATVVVTAASLSIESGVSIGRPMPGVRTLVVSPTLQVIPKGMHGELLILGPTLAEGYLGEPELTESKFVLIDLDGQSLRAFRTGDLVRQDDNDLLHYIGRIDHEVKVAGQRLNLSELESALESMAGVSECCAVISDSESCLRVHIHGDSAQESVLRQAIAQYYPSSLQPRRYHWHDQPLPKTLAGKVDRQKLAGMAIGSLRAIDSGVNLDGNCSLMTRRARELWQETLAGGQCLQDSDFFELGGDSLMAIRIINRINAEMGFELTLKDVLEHVRFGDFVNHLSQVSVQRYNLTEPALVMRQTILALAGTEQSGEVSHVYFDHANDWTIDETLRLLDAPGNGQLTICGFENEFARRGLHRHMADVAKPRLRVIAPTATVLPWQAEGERLLAVFTVPQHPAALHKWMMRCLGRIEELRERYELRVAFLGSVTGVVHFRRAVFTGLRSVPVEILLPTIARQERFEQQQASLVQWSVRLGLFPERLDDDGLLGLSEFLDAVLVRPTLATSQLSVVSASFSAAQRLNPALRLCSHTQWLTAVSEHLRR